MTIKKEISLTGFVGFEFWSGAADRVQHLTDVYTDEQRADSGSWTQYCYNIDYLNGWLYGAVQAVNGIMKPVEK